MFLSPCRDILYDHVFHRVVKLDPSLLVTNCAFLGGHFHTQSWHYHLLPTNLFTYGIFRTGVFGTSRNFRSLLLHSSQLVWNVLLLPWNSAQAYIKKNQCGWLGNFITFIVFAPIFIENMSKRISNWLVLHSIHTFFGIVVEFKPSVLSACLLPHYSRSLADSCCLSCCRV